MKTRSISIIFSFICLITVPANAQILKKLKEKVEEATQEVVKELGLDEKANQNNEKQEKESGADISETDIKNSGSTKSNSTSILSRENVFSGGTTVFDYGTVQNDGRGEYIISPDAKHAAIPGLEGSRQVIIIDGKKGPTFDQVFFSSLVFSPTGGRYAYLARRNNKCIIVIDGEEKDSYDCIANSRGNTAPIQFYFSPDTKDFAYLKPTNHGNDDQYFRGQTSQVILNGIEGPILQNFNSFLFKGGKLFYTGSLYAKGNKTLKNKVSLFINNKPEKTFMSINNLLVGDDGSNYAYIGLKRDTIENKVQKFLVQNGEILDEVNNIHLMMDVKNGILISSITEEYLEDGKRKNRTKLKIGNKFYELSNEQYLENPGHSSINRGSFAGVEPNVVQDASGNNYKIIMSMDGQQHAFLTKRTGFGGNTNYLYTVWRNGKQGREYENISNLKFTPDGQKLVYTATSNRKFFVIENEKEFGPYESLSHLGISPGGGSYAYLASDGNNSHWYVNGKPISGGSGKPEEFQFSPDGSRFAFSGFNNEGEPVIIVDGNIRKQKLGDFFQTRALGRNNNKSPYKTPFFVFSPDSKNLMYPIVSKPNGVYNRRELVINDRIFIHAEDSSVYGFPTFSNDSQNTAYLHPIRKPGEPLIWQLYINNKPGPIVGKTFPQNPSAVSFVDSNTVSVLAFADNEIKKYNVKF